jgi:hypothetical protein
VAARLWRFNSTVADAAYLESWVLDRMTATSGTSTTAVTTIHLLRKTTAT